MSVVSPTILAPLSRLGVVQHGPHLWHEWLSDTFFILPWICRLFADILTLQCHLLSWNSYNVTRLDVKCIDTENKTELLSPTYLGLGWKKGDLVFVHGLTVLYYVYEDSSRIVALTYMAVGHASLSWNSSWPAFSCTQYSKCASN